MAAVSRALCAGRFGSYAGVIDLAVGHPHESTLPVEAFARAAQVVFADGRASLLNYGPERGAVRLRERLAEFLEHETETPADPARLFASAGASMALDLLCTLLTSPGDLVLAPLPTYYRALRTFTDHGLRVRGVASDSDGVDPDALEAELQRDPAALVYLIPSFANPSGVTMPPERRRRVLEITAAHGVRVIADDVYQLLALDGRPTPRFGAGEDHVIGLGSWSKILAPALRLGWIEGSPALLARIESSGLLQSGGGLNPLTGALVDELLANGTVPLHLAGLRGELAGRAAALGDAIARELPGSTFARASGGYFIWLRLPETDTTALLAAAEEEGVRFEPGERFALGGAARDFLRLSFSRNSTADLATGVARLARAVRCSRRVGNGDGCGLAP